MHFHPVDLAIYAAHGGFWAAFVGARFASRHKAPPADKGPAAVEKKTAKHSHLLVWLHFVAFGVMYCGIGIAVFFGGTPKWFSGQQIAGAIVIGAGAILAVTAVWYFRSWRFRAEVTAGHQLATGGPFAIWRHPIYTALTLLALGTALWIPSPIVWIGFILMALGSDLRGRAEEKLLLQTFGSDYIAYRARTWRFVPGLY